MTNNKIVIALIVIIAIIAIGGYKYPQGNTVVERVVERLGASAGPEHLDTQYFIGGAGVGSGCFTATSTRTLTAGDLNSNSCIYIGAIGAGQATISLTLPPATTTESTLLTEKGMCREWFIDASDVAAATTTTFVAGDATDLVGLDATGAGTGADVIDGAEMGTLKLCRQTGNRMTGYIQEWIHSD